MKIMPLENLVPYGISLLHSDASVYVPIPQVYNIQAVICTLSAQENYKHTPHNTHQTGVLITCIYCSVLPQSHQESLPRCSHSHDTSSRV